VVEYYLEVNEGLKTNTEEWIMCFLYLYLYATDRLPKHLPRTSKPDGDKAVGGNKHSNM